MKIFDGKTHAKLLDIYIKDRLKVSKTIGKLLIVLIGNNQLSLKYIKLKMKLCEELGIKVDLERIDSDLADEEIFKKITNAFNDPEVSGGLIQLPLPRESLKKCLDLIPPEKDVDLISSINISQYLENDFNRLPPVVRAFNYFFQIVENKDAFTAIELSEFTEFLKQKPEGTVIRLVGDGFLVGKPLNHFLKSFDNITVDNSKLDIGDKIYSDYLVCGVGSPNLIKGTDISSNCNVIDFGTSLLDEKIVGDLDKNSDCVHLGTVAFSPGGIGPVVVRFLVINFLDLALN